VDISESIIVIEISLQTMPTHLDEQLNVNTVQYRL